MKYTTDEPLFNDIVNRVEAYRQNRPHKIDIQTKRPFYEAASNAGRAAADRDYLLEVVFKLQREKKELEGRLASSGSDPLESTGMAGPRGWD